MNACEFFKYIALYALYLCCKLAVTLFELMVVNNWWIIMEGFRIAVMHRDSRAFFICFHLSTIVVRYFTITYYVHSCDFLLIKRMLNLSQESTLITYVHSYVDTCIDAILYKFFHNYVAIQLYLY